MATGKDQKPKIGGTKMINLEISAEIKGIKYKPFLCKELKTFDFTNIDVALNEEPSFKLRIDDKNEIAVSWWVSPKRTRSYPYARVYDTLAFPCKRVTIIPVMKDEGADGDRDFLQWDTVSLMSLLGIYVIISYYFDASKNPKFKNKITNQKFDINHIKSEITGLVFYQSDALHWNLSQLDKVGEIAKLALKHYKLISQKCGVKMHSPKPVEKRINRIRESKEKFMEESRKLAEKAQKRERVTKQPKENLSGIKAALTIKNYLGGVYHFTCDEVEIHDNELYLIEGKHSREKKLPSLDDIKDGLLRMVVFTNLENVRIGEKEYRPVSILKLTTAKDFDLKRLENSEIRELIQKLKKEARENRFRLLINNTFID